MCRYKLIGETIGGPVEVLVGWSPLFCYYYMFIEPERKYPLYCCISDKNINCNVLRHYQIVLERFGIRNINLKKGGILHAQLVRDRIKYTK